AVARTTAWQQPPSLQATASPNQVFRSRAILLLSADAPLISADARARAVAQRRQGLERGVRSEALHRLQLLEGLLGPALALRAVESFDARDEVAVEVDVPEKVELALRAAAREGRQPGARIRADAPHGA